MRLQHLCDASWVYDLYHEVSPSDGRDGRVYGEGTGTLTGRLAGTATWSNFPRLRPGHASPDGRGVIQVEEGIVLFTLTGLSSLTDGRGVHVLAFQTEAPSHLWLNDVLAVGEGAIDVERRRLQMRYYECEVELPLPALPGD
jgi:hypothetical protein